MIFIRLNDFKSSSLTLIIIFDKNHLFVHSFQVFLSYIDNFQIDQFDGTLTNTTTPGQS